MKEGDFIRKIKNKNFSLKDFSEHKEILNRQHCFCLYWIHTTDQTNPFKEGYIGITSNIQTRMYNHKRNCFTEEGYNSVLTRVIKKYEDLLVSILHVFKTEQQACEKEFYYRPKNQIGWNILAGGKPPSSEYLKSIWDKNYDKMYQKIHTDRSRVKKSENKTNFYKDINNRRNASLKAINRWERDGPWSAGMANKEVWMIADKIYNFWLQTKYGYRRIEGHFGLRKMSTNTMIILFKKGWVPYEDQRWLDEFKRT